MAKGHSKGQNFKVVFSLITHKYIGLVLHVWKSTDYFFLNLVYFFIAWEMWQEREMIKGKVAY